MKKLFYSGLAGLVIFEVLKVYFIMPMPGSQRINSLDLAYFLHTYRWFFRIAFLLAIGAGSRAAFSGRLRLVPAISVLIVAAIVWFFNFQMMADHMFRQPRTLVLKPQGENKVDENSVVLGFEHNGEARAYPIRYLVYHHQVQDTVGGKPVLITYCSVCRTGRVFEPTVGGRPEKFRLVGMDHFNAMFEDESTGSWWRQATGEAVTGPNKGSVLPEAIYSQLTLQQWFKLHPASLVMQPDVDSTTEYDAEGKYEQGKSKGKLTRTDSASWQDKSWVVGVQSGALAKAYDWNRLKQDRVINGSIGATPIVLVLSTDGKSFGAFERHEAGEIFTVKDDILSANGRSYDIFGRSITGPEQPLKRINAYQEFWHSWRTFHLGTQHDS